MSAIRHGREVLPAYVAKQARAAAAARYRCGWCSYVGSRDEVDAHEDAEHPESLAALVTR